MVVLDRHSKGIIPYLPEEVDHFEQEVRRFKAGEIEPDTFMAFRLKQGVYGQRQPDTQMIRVKIIGGIVTDESLDALGEVASRYAPLNKGHVTTRENIQYHHVPLEDMAELMRLIGQVELTSREACGNTVRNVITCPLAGICKTEPFDIRPYMAAYSRRFVRHEVTQAMPRKFKTAFSPCPTDCAVTSMHDLGFIARVQEVDGVARKGFELRVGGGTSIMPKLAPTLYEFVAVEDMLKVCEAVLRVFNQANELRRDRMMARIKVLVNRVGIAKFREMVEEELKQPWAQEEIDIEDYLWEDAGDVPAPDPGRPLLRRLRPGETSPEYTRWRATNIVEQRQFGFHGVYVKVPQGDLSSQQFHALADITRRFGNRRAMLTAEQNVLLRWVRQEDLYDVWDELNSVGLGEGGVHEITDVTSCPGTDSCKLGITNSMGLGRAVAAAVQGYDDPLVRAMHVKISGCPNGCGRHHIADIGFHGASFKGDEARQVPSYEVFVGGRYEGGTTQYGQRIKVKLPAKKVPEAVQRIVAYYAAERAESESFQEFVERVGPKSLEPVLADMSRSAEKFNMESLPLYMDWERDVLFIVQRGEGECAV